MTDYPVGQTWCFDLGFAKIAHALIGTDRMRYRVLSGPRAGEEGMQAIQVNSVGSRQFLVSWQEPDRHIIVHFEDFATEHFRAFVVTPEGSFLRREGRMRRLIN